MLSTEASAEDAATYRWHFDMLNDRDRNASYARAIERATASVLSRRSDCSALDIGTGSGLLALLCAKSGCSAVAAVEQDEKLGAIAAENARACGYGDGTMVVCAGHSGTMRISKKKSTSTSTAAVPSSEHHTRGVRLGKKRMLKRRPDIIVSEVLDSGLLGEDCIPTLRHAATVLAPGGVMIPSRARVFAQVRETYTCVCWKGVRGVCVIGAMACMAEPNLSLLLLHVACRVPLP